MSGLLCLTNRPTDHDIYLYSSITTTTLIYTVTSCYFINIYLYHTLYPLLLFSIVQLICPISYEDKDSIWLNIEKFICDRLPLKDISLKNPTSLTYINIEKLPIRFLPSTAKLFNETNHPYRRFLAPYVHVYLLSAETMDIYKTTRVF